MAVKRLGTDYTEDEVTAKTNRLSTADAAKVDIATPDALPSQPPR